jgi:hypothetical protein
VSDERIRRLERDARAGDPVAAEALARARRRVDDPAEAFSVRAMAARVPDELRRRDDWQAALFEARERGHAVFRWIERPRPRGEFGPFASAIEHRVTLTAVAWACGACGGQWDEVQVEGEPPPSPTACPLCGRAR